MTRSAKLDPLSPARADYRILRKIIESSSLKVLHRPEEYDIILAVFLRAGGSWERLFGGHIHDLRLLKKIAKIAYKRKHLTPAPSWG